MRLIVDMPNPKEALREKVYKLVEPKKSSYIRFVYDFKGPEGYMLFRQFPEIKLGTRTELQKILRKGLAW